MSRREGKGERERNVGEGKEREREERNISPVLMFSMPSLCLTTLYLITSLEKQKLALVNSGSITNSIDQAASTTDIYFSQF